MRRDQVCGICEIPATIEVISYHSRFYACDEHEDWLLNTCKDAGVSVIEINRKAGR